jgi:hypothetical protein
MDKSVQVIYWDSSAVLSALFTDTHSKVAKKWSIAKGVHFEKNENPYKPNLIDRFDPYFFHCRQFFLCRRIGTYAGTNPGSS